MPTYKDEKTGLWYCKFVYMDWTGQRKQKKKMGFRLQKEAKQFEIDFLSKTAKNCDMSFGSMVDIYMEDCKARLKPTTYQGKEAVIAKHILPYFRHLRINDIQPMTVRRWQTDLINSTQNYKPTYLRTLNSQLSAIFNFAMKYYGLPSNPVQKSGTIGKNIPVWNNIGPLTNSKYLLKQSAINQCRWLYLTCYIGPVCVLVNFLL